MKPSFFTFVAFLLVVSFLHKTQAQAQPLPQEFLSKFSANVSFPYQIDAVENWHDTIPANMVILHIFQKAHKAGLGTFYEFWGENAHTNLITQKALHDKQINPEKNVFMVMNVGFGKKFTFPNTTGQSFIIHINPTLMEGTYSYSYLVHYAPNGDMIDALQLSGQAGYVDMQQSWASQIQKNGKIQTQHTLWQRAEMGMGEDFKENNETFFQVQNNGKVQLIKKVYESIAGEFADENGSFRIIKTRNNIRVIYANEQEKELEIITYNPKNNKILVKMPQTNQVTELNFNFDKTELVCGVIQKDIAQKDTFRQMKRVF